MDPEISILRFVEMDFNEFQRRMDPDLQMILAKKNMYTFERQVLGEK